MNLESQNSSQSGVNAADFHTSTNLCNCCQNIFANWSDVITDEYQVKFPHHEDIFALQASAAQGCALCGQFLRNLASRGELDTARESTTEILNNGSLTSGCWVRVISFKRILSSRAAASAGCKLLELRVCLEDLEEDEDSADSDLSESQSDSEDNIMYRDDEFESIQVRSPNHFVCKAILMPASPEPLNRGNSQKSLANSRDALHLAKGWLWNCCQTHNGCNSLHGFVPTRLLFINGDSVALRLSSTIQPSTKYATLSHCWGSLHSLILTVRNLQLLLKGLHLATLCKTFQDAVYICQELGLKYIWIDSLCIIQDDPEDWKRESKMMSSIYSGSTINIAATSAADGNGGCLFDRDAKRSWRHRINTSLHGQELQYDCVEDGISDACLFQTPLASRAWAIQERLLAPRTLHCSLTQLFWECNSTTACEAFPQGFPDTLNYGDFHLPKQPVSRSLWPKIVKLYSGCHLTFSKDKLIAISGIAKMIYDQNVEDEYVAGLWRRGIEYQLCWKIRTQRPKVEVPRAPSWSWASVDGIVDFPTPSSYEDRRYINVLDVSIGLQDPFGEILTGKLILSCVLLLRGTFDTATALYKPHIKLESRTCRIRSNLDCLGEQPETVHLLPVIGKDINHNLNIRGLILQRSETLPTEYRRIGCFECDDFFDDECNDFENQAEKEDISITIM